MSLSPPFVLFLLVFFYKQLMNKLYLSLQSNKFDIENIIINNNTFYLKAPFKALNITEQEKETLK